MAELTFGEPLHLLDSSEYTAWVKVVLAAFKVVMYKQVFTERSEIHVWQEFRCDEQSRLKSEVTSTFATIDSINLDQLAELKYLNACLEEALRMYPPVPVGLPHCNAGTGRHYLWSICSSWSKSRNILRYSYSYELDCRGSGPFMRHTIRHSISLDRTSLFLNVGLENQMNSPMTTRKSFRHDNPVHMLHFDIIR
jgi:cytochrome P450